MGKTNFEKFREKIIYEKRNVCNDRIFVDLEHKETNPYIELNKKDVLYRCRIISDSDERDIGRSKKFQGFDAEGSLMPPPNKTKDYRANYKYIPCLYCSNEESTAIGELKLSESTKISVAKIKPNKKLVLLDIRGIRKIKEPTKNNLFKNLADWFSKPTSDSDDITEYIPTQYVSEYIRDRLNYDGIAYKSAQDKGNGYNIALFYKEGVRAISSKVKNIKVTKNNERN